MEKAARIWTKTGGLGNGYLYLCWSPVVTLVLLHMSHKLGLLSLLLHMGHLVGLLVGLPVSLLVSLLVGLLGRHLVGLHRLTYTNECRIFRSCVAFCTYKSREHTCIYAQTSLILIYTHKQSDTRIETLTSIRARAYIHAYTDARTQYIYACMQAHMQAQMRFYTQARTLKPDLSQSASLIVNKRRINDATAGVK